MAAQILALLEDNEQAKEVAVSLWIHDVLVATSFRDAMQILNDHPVDLIISDVHLENGGTIYDFLRWVKANPHLRPIPFVLFSLRPNVMAKYLSEGVRTSARLLGAAKYISMHTFDPVSFRTEIDELLKESEIAEPAARTDEDSVIPF